MNKKILKGVSRSFYLSLVFLPRRMRTPVSLAFLACKAADTIADTELISKEERLKWLDAYRELFTNPASRNATDISEAIASPQGGSVWEKRLIESLPTLMDDLQNLPPKDWLLIQELVLELTQGMQMDLSERASGLAMTHSMTELDQYIYYVAGCVGRFWTKMIKIHFSFSKNFGLESEDIGEKIGKGLQLVNILRDLPQDLKRGRTYIPHGVSLADIFKLARSYLGEYERYCAYFPWYAVRLKAVVRLPARLGLLTLDRLESSKEWPAKDLVIKVSRGQVYKTLLGSFFK
ncbi:MAG: phytoene/squalene synthase family protein [Deltaproteobacteria bacterium]|nr:phytoene/squalene synthase family protein [Deltaproteobacteria bacterium]